jgi:DNA-directed RNA polymerase specialized sigma24 family protein
MLRWARKVRSAGKGRNDYATHSDFCAIFLQQLDRLYWLALILTGDELRAEECFHAALDSCVEGSLVFKESAVAWSRRSVIKCAIRFMLPSPSSPSRPALVANRCDSSSGQDASLKSVQELSLFDRFVFVMSVLERYSDRECALLLECSNSNILAARVSAFQQMSITRLSKSYAGHARGAHASVVDADWLECG